MRSAPSTAQTSKTEETNEFESFYKFRHFQSTVCSQLQNQKHYIACLMYHMSPVAHKCLSAMKHEISNPRLDANDAQVIDKCLLESQEVAQEMDRINNAVVQVPPLEALFSIVSSAAEDKSQQVDEMSRDRLSLSLQILSANICIGTKGQVQ